MSETLIASLNQRISELERENADLRAEAKKRRLDKKAAEAKVAEIEGQLSTLTADRDKWKASAEAAPGDKDKRIVELESQIRTRDHRDAFAKALNGSLHDKASVADVWSKIEYQPGDELPGEEQLAELVGKAREAAPYLFREAEGETPTTGRDGPTQASGNRSHLSGPGGGRGGPDTTAKKVTYRRDEIRQPGWQRNRPELVKAMKEGRAVRID